MSGSIPPLPLHAARVRSRPHRLEYEQEDEWRQAEEAAQLLSALRLSMEAPPSSSESECSSDEKEDEAEAEDEQGVGGLVDEEEDIADHLYGEARETYDELLENEKKAGWSRVPSPVKAHPFIPPAAGPRPSLANCSTPLDFFHAILPLTFFDYMVERVNEYAEGRRAPGKENAPPARATRESSHCCVRGAAMARDRHGRLLQQCTFVRLAVLTWLPRCGDHAQLAQGLSQVDDSRQQQTAGRALVG
jgi:hypothetical protein